MRDTILTMEFHYAVAHHRLFDSLNPSKREAILELWKGGAQLAEVEDPDQSLDADEVFGDDQEFIDSLDEMLEEIEKRTLEEEEND